MTYLSSSFKLDKWKWFLIFSALSTIFISITYINPPSDPKSAGSMFAYNFSFFFPIFGISFWFGLIAIVYLIRFVRDLKDHEIKYKKSRIITTIVLLIPMLVHLIPLLILLLIPVD